MKIKYLLFWVTILLVASFPVAAQSGESRGFLFQGGLGFAGVSYPDYYEAALDELASIPGVDRIQLNLHLGAGYGIGGGWYGSFLLDGYADRLDDGVNYIQTNTYLYGFGVQGFPLGQGLMLGAHVGPARLVFDSDFLGTDTSDWGVGFATLFASFLYK